MNYTRVNTFNLGGELQSTPLILLLEKFRAQQYFLLSSITPDILGDWKIFFPLGPLLIYDIHPALCLTADERIFWLAF